MHPYYPLPYFLTVKLFRISISKSSPLSTIGQIYQQSFQTHLQKIGQNLYELRIARRKDIETVVAAVNIRPDVLIRIESGQHDARIKTIYALCDYYKVALEPVVNQGLLINFKSD